MLQMSSASHSYLGNDLLDVHCRTFFDAGNEIDIPIINLDEIVVFPVCQVPNTHKNTNGSTRMK